MRSAIVLMSIVFLGGGISAQDMRISLDRVDTLINGKLPHDYPISFYFRMTNTSIHDINGLSSGFRIYSPDGATWSAGFFVDTILTCDFSPVVCYDTTFYGEWIDSTLPSPYSWQYPEPSIFDGGLFVVWYSIDGTASDTIGFAAYTQSTGSGLFSGFDYVSFRIKLQEISDSSVGKTICLDSAFFPPSGRWLWANSGDYVPEWDGPRCWTVSAAEPPPLPPPTLSVRLDSVEGLVNGRLPINRPIAFRFRYTNNTDHTMISSANGFRVYSPDGATWQPGLFIEAYFGFPLVETVYDTSYYGEWDNSTLIPPLVWKGPDPQVFDYGLFVNWFSVKGYGADTVGFSGYAQMTGLGLYPGFSGVGPTIVIQGIPESSSGKTLCIDSAFFPPTGFWEWAQNYSIRWGPFWDGPHCFEIGSCCVGMRGNVDLTDDEINIADLTGLVHQIFVKRQLDCPLACNVDGDANETVDIMDLAYLVDYMFKGGPAPPAGP